MAFWFRSRRLLKRLNLKRVSGKEESEWLKKIKPYDGELLHKTSKALLNEFISLASRASAAGRIEQFIAARQLHIMNTRVQADLMKSLPQTSGLRDFVAKQFPPKEHVFKEDLEKTTKVSGSGEPSPQSLHFSLIRSLRSLLVLSDAP